MEEEKKKNVEKESLIGKNKENLKKKKNGGRRIKTRNKDVCQSVSETDRQTD